METHPEEGRRTRQSSSKQEGGSILNAAPFLFIVFLKTELHVASHIALKLPINLVQNPRQMNPRLHQHPLHGVEVLVGIAVAQLFIIG